MRLVLTVRGTNVVDLELRWPGKNDGDVSAPPKLEASGGGQVGRADQYGDPATQVGFGFALPAKGERHGAH